MSFINTSNEIKTQLDETVDKTTEKEFKQKSIGGKISTISGSIFNQFLEFLSYIVVFIISVLSVFYIFNKFEETEKDPYPSDPMKFPFVFYNSSKTIDDQDYITTLNINTERSDDDPLFKNVDIKTNVNGNIDIGDTLNSIGQSDDIKNPSQMNYFASWFNRVNKDILGSNFGIMNLSLYVILSGILSTNNTLNMIHNSMGNFYRSTINNNDIISKFILFAITWFSCTSLFFMFNDSRESFYNLTEPILNPTKTGKGEFMKENMSKVILNIFSGLMSGFMALLKVFFIFSYVVFVGSSVSTIFDFFKSLQTMTSGILSCVMLLSFFVSFILVMVNLYNESTKNKKDGSTSFTDTFMISIIKSMKESAETLAIYIQKVAGEFKKAITPADMLSNNSGKDKCGFKTNNSTGSFNKMFNMLFYILSIPLYICFLPLLLIPIVFLLISLFCVSIPLFSSLYMGLNLSSEISFKSIQNITNLFKYFKPNYISIFLSFFVCFAYVLSLSMKEYGMGSSSLNLVSNISNIFIFLISLIAFVFLYYVKAANNDNTESPNNSSIAYAPFIVGIIYAGHKMFSVISDYIENK